MQGGCVHNMFQPISRSLAIQTMVDPPPPPPGVTIVEIAKIFLDEFPELWLFKQW